MNSVIPLLICKVFNPDLVIEVPQDTDWEEALYLAMEQGVLGICFEGIEKLPANQRPGIELLAQWYGQVELQRSQYEQTWTIARKLDKLWASEGIQAIVLKGRSIAQYYPVPNHRYSCDLDVFIKQGWVQACKMLESRGVKLEHEVYKEAEFYLENIYIECHRYITPLRGNKHLQKIEQYLYFLLDNEPKRYFEGTTLVCPSLEFIVIIYVEHALGDYLHGKLLLKHIVDWIVLRKQHFHQETIEAKCKEFRFERFLAMIDALADIIEGKKTYESLTPTYQRIYDETLQKSESIKPRSWFRRRVALFFDIMKNYKKYSDFGYISMPQFLFNSVWSHFFDKEVKI